MIKTLLIENQSNISKKYFSYIFRGSLGPFIIIALSAAIPLLLLGIVSGYRSSTQERQTVALQVALRAERLAHQIEGQLEGEIEAAQPLVNLKRLNKDDTSSFLEHAQRLEGLHHNWLSVSLASVQGPQILNANEPDGTPVGSNAAIDGFGRTVETEKATIGNFMPAGTLAATASIPIHFPVVRQQSVRFVVTVGISPGAFEETLITADLPAGWDGALVDAGGRIIASTDNRHRRQFGTGDLFDISVCCRDNSTIHEEILPNGQAVYAVSQRIPLSGWTVHLRMPMETLDKPVHRAWRMIILAGIGALLLTSLLASLVAHYIAASRRVEIQGAEQVLRLSEAWRLLAVEIADIGTWHWPFGTDTIEWCERCMRLCSLPKSQSSYDAFLAAVHPDDRPTVDKAMQQCRRDHTPYEVNFRALMADGAVRWLRISGQVPEQNQGQAAGIYGVIINIDKQKRAEAEHRALLSRLNSAQEDERRRIARDLHDRVGQTVAGLSLRLKRLEVEAASPATKDACAELKRMISDISQDIHRAAVELRPTALDDIGLRDALFTLLEDWRQRSGIEVDVFINGLDGERLPAFIETTIYRIIVELLTNIVKHADATAVSATLDRRSGQVVLIVEDNGCGFAQPIGMPSSQRHLGLLGIRERLELVNGQMEIESEIGGGTTVFVRIPLPSASQEEEAA
ncbi:ATP-binding protein [Telmatospirillum sp.]|uniref:sensor histidine kinase n=1 Tax=Telmatospirillum sp. TaxID=2079197 RepID=UPI00283B5427|nr:ATP-binding protein [Telmatospirillum sp.]MDR3435204.1 PAS domain-containing protein [Telmatospirillum sp.]